MSGLIGAALGILYTIVELATALWNGQTYATNMQHQLNTKGGKINT